jgi:hypothetical protein
VPCARGRGTIVQGRHRAIPCTAAAAIRTHGHYVPKVHNSQPSIGSVTASVAQSSAVSQPVRDLARGSHVSVSAEFVTFSAPGSLLRSAAERSGHGSRGGAAHRSRALCDLSSATRGSVDRCPPMPFKVSISAPCKPLDSTVPPTSAATVMPNARGVVRIALRSRRTCQAGRGLLQLYVS